MNFPTAVIKSRPGYPQALFPYSIRERWPSILEYWTGQELDLPLELAVEEIFQDIEVVAERERTETAASEQVVQGEMIDVQRVLKIMGVRVRVGFRIFNVTNTFNARDIQNNIDAAGFGTTFNSPGRAFGGTFQIVQ